MCVLKCKGCGAPLNLPTIEGEGATLSVNTVVECDFCGNQQTIPSLDSKKN